jgi:Leucine-rich repeat (LRR) protein
MLRLVHAKKKLLMGSDAAKQSTLINLQSLTVQRLLLSVELNQQDFDSLLLSVNLNQHFFYNQIVI